MRARRRKKLPTKVKDRPAILTPNSPIQDAKSALADYSAGTHVPEEVVEAAEKYLRDRLLENKRRARAVIMQRDREILRALAK